MVAPWPQRWHTGRAGYRRTALDIGEGGAVAPNDDALAVQDIGELPLISVMVAP